MNREEHTIPPIYNKDSNILILGSFPSVKSREGGFFYNHPQNRFWQVISRIYQVDLPVTIDEKKAMLLTLRLALWDVIKSCEITGSSDSSIKNVVPNDIRIIFKTADIKEIVCNGNTSYNLYMKYIYPDTGIKPLKLPSTSPANAGYSMDRLVKTWSQIRL